MAEKKKEVNMTRKTISRIMGLIIAVFLLAVVLPLGSGEAKAATKGSKGDWEFEYEGKRLTITKNVDERLLGTEVPRLIIQPIVENAVEHGTKASVESRISIDIFEKDE